MHHFFYPAILTFLHECEIFAKLIAILIQNKDTIEFLFYNPNVFEDPYNNR